MEQIVFEQKNVEHFKLAKYELGDINEFIEGLRNLKVYVSSNCDNKSYGAFAGHTQTKLLAIYEILRSKKLQKNIKDLKKLGQYIQELGNEIENYEETMKKYANDENTSNHEEKVKEFLKSIIEDLFEDED